VPQRGCPLCPFYNKQQAKQVPAVYICTSLLLELAEGVTIHWVLMTEIRIEQEPLRNGDKGLCTNGMIGCIRVAWENKACLLENLPPGSMALAASKVLLHASGATRLQPTPCR